MALQKRFCDRTKVGDDAGFASAQWVLLMSLTVVVLATIVNIFLIEYFRFASLGSLHDAARAGTRVVDLERTYGTPQQSDAENACVDRMRASVQDLLNNAVEDTNIQCQVVIDGDRYLMRASMSTQTTATLVPWAQPFAARLHNLSATYEQRKAAQ